MQQNSSVNSFSGSDSWVILSPIEQSIKRKIESVGTPLSEWDINIYRGVLTGYNEAFIISTEKREQILSACKTEDERSRTAELIRPILRGRDIKRYGYDWANLWLIYIPWHFPLQFDNSIQGASPVAEEAFKKQYPVVYAHMLQYKKELSARNKAETGIRYEWYAMQRWGSNYWEDFFKPKIVYGQFQDKAEYSFAREGIFLSSNEYMLIARNYSTKCLLAFLNCKASEWLLGNITGNLGGNAKIGQKSNFVKLSIPILNKQQQLLFEKKVDDILQANKDGHNFSEIEQEIDYMIYALYKLTKEEIAIINNS